MTDADGRAGTGRGGLPPGTLLVTVGPGGAGKSAFAAAAVSAAAVDAVVCLDALCRETAGPLGDRSVTLAAVVRQAKLLEQHLAAGETVLADSDNTDPRMRTSLLEHARRHRRPAVAVRFSIGLATCLQRNRARPFSMRVPENVLRRQHGLARHATEAVLLAEGFTAVYTEARARALF